MLAHRIPFAKFREELYGFVLMSIMYTFIGVVNLHFNRPMFSHHTSIPTNKGNLDQKATPNACEILNIPTGIHHTFFTFCLP